MQWDEVRKPPTTRTLRQFAVLWLIFFGSIGVWRIWHGSREVGAAMVGLAVIVGLLGIMRPLAIRWIFTGWLIAAFPIGWVVSQVMLGVLFYGMFTPVALLFKAIGRDALRVRRTSSDTYYVPKPGSDARGYFRQF